MEAIVLPLATLLRTLALAHDKEKLQSIQATCRLLNVLVVVRGYKTVARFFPHEAADLERVLNLLLEVKSCNAKTGEEGLASWESQAILLLWLSILILMPFGLATLDSAAMDGSWCVRGAAAPCCCGA